MSILTIRDVNRMTLASGTLASSNGLAGKSSIHHRQKGKNPFLNSVNIGLIVLRRSRLLRITHSLAGFLTRLVGLQILMPGLHVSSLHMTILLIQPCVQWPVTWL